MASPAVAPARDQSRRVVGAARDQRDLLAALGEVAELGRQAVERSGKSVERVGEVRLRAARRRA